MKNKVIISSILTIAMCLSMIAGSTFAIFAGNSGVNVAVTSGQVQVTANVVEDSLKTYSLGNETLVNGTFENGGTATLTNASTLNLNGLSVGDEATFTIKVENSSTIDVQYRVRWHIEGELADVLEATVDGNKIVNSTSDWTVWGKDATEKVKNLSISVSFPLSAINSNEYAGKSANITFTVEAVQKNGVGLVLLNGRKMASFDAAMTAANEGDTITVYGEQSPMVINKNVTVEMNGVLINAANGHAVTLTSDATVKVIGDSHLHGGKSGSAIYVGEGAKLTLTGDTLTAVGNGGKDYVAGAAQYSSDDNATEWTDTGASAIGGKGEIYIDTMKSLTALGYGVHASGIGGESTKITIKNTTIEKARGGYLNENDTYLDSKYLKSEPEGGAAIGSSVHGAVITLDNVTVKEALGGSKAAGIGAMFHNGATINITNSVITKVVGGNSSAGIGSSRVASEDIDQASIINISGSTINAIGGRYGAGIGSGYDTHCMSHGDKSRVTINITGDRDDTITAQGGTYAAGIGTGYHTADLAGSITGDVVINATSGDKFYKDAYTQAQDIGFGVIDPAREGKNNNSTFNNNGNIIFILNTVPNVSDVAGAFDMNKDVTVGLPSGEHSDDMINITGTGTSDSNFTIIGSNTVFTNSIEITNHSNLILGDDAVLVIDGITVNGTLKVTSYYKNIVIKNVTAKSIWVNANSNVTIENCTIDGASDNGIYIVGYSNGYNLTIKNNVIRNSAKNAIQISGCASGRTFNGGTFTVEGNTFENWCTKDDNPRSAFKVWGDGTYCPDDITGGTPNNAAIALINAVRENNTFKPAEGKPNQVRFDFYGYICE